MKIARWAWVAVVGAAMPLFAVQEPPAKAESRTAYIRRMFERDRATFGDACRMVASLSEGKHTDSPFAEISAKLVEQEVVESGWGLQESSLVTKDTLSYMLCRALGIRGGLTTAIFGMSRRYAFRECVYRGLMAGGTPGEHISGRELIDVMSHAGVFKAEGNLDSILR